MVLLIALEFLFIDSKFCRLELHVRNSETCVVFLEMWGGESFSVTFWLLLTRNMLFIYYDEFERSATFSTTIFFFWFFARK